MPEKITSLSTGQAYTYKGDIQIDCDIPNDVTIIVKNGSIMALKKVGDGVVLRTKGKKQSGDISITSGSNIIITGGSISGDVTINGKKVSGDFNGKIGKSKMGDIVLLGTAGKNLKIDAIGSIKADAAIGSHAILDCSGSMSINNLGAGSKCNAAGSFKGADIAQGCVIDVAGSVKATCLGDDVKIDASGSVQLKDAAGQRTHVDCGGSVKMNSCGKGSNIDTAGSISITTVHENTECDAGGSITLDTAYNAVSCQAGGSIKIKRAGKGVKTSAGGHVKMTESDIDLPSPDAEVSAEKKNRAVTSAIFKKFRR